MLQQTTSSAKRLKAGKMLEYAIFAVTFVVFLIAAVIYLYPGSSKPSSIPGLDPTTEEDGNVSDIARAGSLHEFLLDLHKQFGSIASFWMGQKFVVSIHSPELFKQHQNVFDRPPELFKLFEPFIGTASIQYANGKDGRNRRNHYDKPLSHESLKQYYNDFQEVANELEKKWSTLVKEEHIPLSQYMSAFALKIVLRALFGQSFKDDKEVLEFRRNYDICWSEMERNLTEPAEPGSQRQKVFEEAYSVIKNIMENIIKHRKENPPKENEDKLLVDVILETVTSESQKFDDCITFAVGGLHTTGNALTWCFYFLATHPEVQDKVYKEIKKELGNNDVDFKNINDLRFDPDRFSPENVKSRPAMAFQPFGFAGKRICPGYRFAYAEATVCLVTLLRKFKVNMVEGQVVNPVHGLVTHPEDEIWITIEKR
ncbi:hypothetical protein KUTeg_008294 [Tegillarca granosa]|uniref:Cytochrome P450 20A1 n=1 Tax=Tegillarca granosa TaxID=220873 RepID=A0ABQ9F8S4_TEGGR|nr:hypothetical protein KUTeg_008294 [Tegillarca granosa]